MANLSLETKLAARFPSMPLITALVAALGVTLGSSSAEAGIPVYLKPESRFASGQYARPWLEARTKDIQLQRWFRVWTKTADRRTVYGWIAEDHVLTQLRLSSIARLTRNEPDRSEPSLDSLRGGRIPKGAQVIILERSGFWSRVRILGENAPNKELSRDSWILNEALVRDPNNQVEKAYVIQSTPIRLQPNLKVKPIESFDPHREVNVVSADGAWLEVQIDARQMSLGLDIQTGWIERKNVWLSSDLISTGGENVRPLFAGLELRSAPLPDANVVTLLSGTEALHLLGSQYLKWGQVRVPNHGALWWPITDGHEADAAAPPMTLSTQELVSRSLFDLAASHSIPGFKIASAKGVFQTTDGKTWKKISSFEEKNFPVAITGSSPEKLALFVGPFLSTDQGRTFSEWIRWDRLVQSIKTKTGLPPNRMRLSALEMIDDSGQKIRLTLDLGRAKPVVVSTKDRGANFTVEL
ncbi:MAG: SH3 domain-containing protein [Bdellovibrionales bacterium]|nr:SH3 domain-containing protein [Bdellovibrionales bacterium]